MPAPDRSFHALLFAPRFARPFRHGARRHGAGVAPGTRGRRTASRHAGVGPHPHPSQGQTCHPDLPARRAQPGRFVRLQAGPRAAARPVGPRRRAARWDSWAGSVGSIEPISPSSGAARAACGCPISFPTSPSVADELTVIRSMWSGTGNHTPATYEANSGFRTLGFPAAGRGCPTAWAARSITCRRSSCCPTAARFPPAAPTTGRAAFCRARHQGVVLNTSGPAGARPAAGLERRRGDAGRPLRRRRRAQSPASRPARHGRRPAKPPAQLRAGRPHATRDSRGDGSESGDGRRRTGSTAPIARTCADFGRACLLARRLVERGVRFVQLWSGAAFGSRRPLGRARQRPGQPSPRVRTRSIGRSPACCATCASAACSTTRSSSSTPSSAARRSPKVAGDQAGTGTRPQSRRLHRLAGRRRAQARHRLRHAPTTSAGRSARTRSTSTTSTPRSCTCSASTTSG